MKHDVMRILIKHIEELYIILGKYKISNRNNFVSVAESDLIFQKAILMTVGYIGELSKKADENIKLSNPDVNWRRLGKSRNIIFHDYDIVDMEIISSVVFKDISALKLIKEIDSNDIEMALDLVRDVFLTFVAPDYSTQGKDTFINDLEKLSTETLSGLKSRKMWACYQAGKIVGVIATRDRTHISLLFTDKKYHKKGIAKYLFNHLLNEFKNETSAKQITVNSSPYAVEIYRRLGFEKTGEQQEKNGIISTPMVYILNSKKILTEDK
ncbi:MAG: GNAT family N-acetyltransferase [Oscillospiraceae bacterium]|nr:GNAT family N-acetyltransferase [Oscillospiraceae bacterium]